MSIFNGPWFYRPREYDDWGTVRASNGDIVCQSRFPHCEDLGKHRINGTDPWEESARLIASAPGLNARIDEVEGVLADMMQYDHLKDVLPAALIQRLERMLDI